MCWSRWAVCLLIGIFVGGGARWITWGARSEPLDLPRQRDSGFARSKDEPAQASSQTISQPTPSEEFSQSHGGDFLNQLVAALQDADTEDLQEWLDDLKKADRLDPVAEKLLFLRWTEVDPSSALTAAAGHDLLATAFWAWGKTAPEAALSYAQRKRIPEWLAAVVRAIAEEDPNRGAALAKSWLQGRPFLTAMKGVRTAIGSTQPARALTMALESHTWDPEIAQEWLRKDPTSAFSWMAANLPYSESFEWMQAMDGLRKAHPDRIGDLIQNLPDGWQRLNLTADYLSHLAFHHPEEARNHLDGLPHSVADYHRAQMAENLFATDLEQAWSFMESMAWSDPSPNPASIRAEYPRGASQRGEQWAALRVFTTFAGHAPERTAAFVETLPENPLTLDACQQLVKQWMQSDAVAASDWAAQMAHGSMRDRAIATVSGYVMRSSLRSERDFEGAALWALQITDPAQRESQLQNVFGLWQRADPEAMRRGLAIRGLPESLRQSFSGSSQ